MLRTYQLEYGYRVDAVRRLGAEIKLVGATYAEAQQYAQVMHMANMTKSARTGVFGRHIHVCFLSPALCNWMIVGCRTGR